MPAIDWPLLCVHLSNWQLRQGKGRDRSEPRSVAIRPDMNSKCGGFYWLYVCFSSGGRVSKRAHWGQQTLNREQSPRAARVTTRINNTVKCFLTSLGTSFQELWIIWKGKKYISLCSWHAFWALSSADVIGFQFNNQFIIHAYEYFALQNKKIKYFLEVHFSLAARKRANT